MSDLVKASDINTKRTEVSTLATNASLSVTLPDAVSTGTVVRYASFNVLQTAINSLESSFSNNCCQSNCDGTVTNSCTSNGCTNACLECYTQTVTNSCIQPQCTGNSCNSCSNCDCNCDCEGCDCP